LRKEANVRSFAQSVQSTNLIGNRLPMMIEAMLQKRMG
jgi:hypothetical protein